MKLGCVQRQSQKTQGSQEPDRKWDYASNLPNQNQAVMDAYLSFPNKDFPFVDALPGTVVYPNSLQGQKADPQYALKWYMQDEPGVPVSDKVSEVKYSVIFDTYVTIPFVNPNPPIDPFKIVIFPIAKLSWKFTSDASNFRLVGNALVCDLGINNKLVPNGPAIYNIHTYSNGQKLTNNVASFGYPLMDA